MQPSHSGPKSSLQTGATQLARGAQNAVHFENEDREAVATFLRKRSLDMLRCNTAELKSARMQQMKDELLCRLMANQAMVTFESKIRSTVNGRTTEQFVAPVARLVKKQKIGFGFQGLLP